MIVRVYYYSALYTHVHAMLMQAEDRPRKGRCTLYVSKSFTFLLKPLIVSCVQGKFRGMWMFHGALARFGQCCTTTTKLLLKL
jgi:hypothetical protein